jgi:hypothetical protein
MRLEFPFAYEMNPIAPERQALLWTREAKEN